MNGRLALAMLALGGLRPNPPPAGPPKPHSAERPSEIDARIASLAKEWLEKR